MMRFKIAVLVSLIFFALGRAWALEPGQILVIANSDSAASVRLAEYYCARRRVPEENILALSLGSLVADSISRSDYESRLAEPIRQTLSSGKFVGKIRCLLTTYGVPFKVGGRGTIKGQEQSLKTLQGLANKKTEQLQKAVAELKILGSKKYASQSGPVKNQPIIKMVKGVGRESKATLSRIRSVRDSNVQKKLFAKWLSLYEQLYGPAKARLAAVEHKKLAGQLSLASQATEEDTLRWELIKRTESERWSAGKRIATGYYGLLEKVSGISGALMVVGADADRLSGRETNASVDSELSMVMFGDYELYRWQMNEFKGRVFWGGARTLMVSRLDGPSEQIAKGLIDKAISAEENGLEGEGMVYVDSRGLATDNQPYSSSYFDRSLVQTAELFRRHGKMAVVQEQSSALFEPGRCPRTAIYCGWYSLRKYIDAFDFIDGAIGYHIASFEAANLRDVNSSQWCAAMLRDGVTATLGAVAEPYLHACPEPRVFFSELLNGLCLAKAYFKAKPFNSWQFVLIGDPLYRPFKKPKVPR